MDMSKIMNIIDHIPGVNLAALMIKVMSEFPSLWDNVPQEEKQKLFNSLVAAGAKAAAEYAKKG